MKKKKDEIMTREEMLKILRSIKIGARPIVATMDMGLEFEYVTSKGWGDVLGPFSEWPVYKISDLSKDKLELIKDRIRIKQLCRDDLTGTDLLMLFDYIFYGRSAEDTPCLSDFFSELLSVGTFDNSIFAICDDLDWKPSAYFYSTYDDMANGFISLYESNTVSWDDCDDSMLKSWIEKLEEFDGIEYKEFDSSN